MPPREADDLPEADWTRDDDWEPYDSAHMEAEEQGTSSTTRSGGASGSLDSRRDILGDPDPRITPGGVDYRIALNQESPSEREQGWDRRPSKGKSSGTGKGKSGGSSKGKGGGSHKGKSQGSWYGKGRGTSCGSGSWRTQGWVAGATFGSSWGWTDGASTVTEATL